MNLNLQRNEQIQAVNGFLLWLNEKFVLYLALCPDKGGVHLCRTGNNL